jgi:hypothetical protein
MTRQAQRWIPALAFTTLLVSSTTDALAQVCTRTAFVEPPSWVSGLAWQSMAERAALVDPKSQRVLLLDLNGGSQSWVSFRDQASGANLVPRGIAMLGAEPWIRFDLGAVARLPARVSAPSLGVAPTDLWRENLDRDGGPLSGQVETLYSNWISLGGRVLGYGAVGRAGADATGPSAGRDFQLGILQARYDRRQQKVIEPSLLVKSDENDFYRMGYPYFAATSSQLFFLRMTPASSRVAVLMAVDSAGRVTPLEGAIPRGFEVLPRQGKSEASVGEILNELERQVFVAGLYAERRDLFLLLHEPAGAAGTTWKLVRYDPATQRAKGTVVLPTTAPHVSLLPGEREWLVIERGSTKNWGEQEIRSFLRVPSAWIEDAASSPLASWAPVSTICGPLAAVAER